MQSCDTLLRNVAMLDGSGSAALIVDVAIADGRIYGVGEFLNYKAANFIEGHGLTLAPGFIDVHTHDDTSVIRRPSMLPKLSQGVTTVVVGNCGISASPVTLRGDPPDPMNLLGPASVFEYPTFASYVAAVEAAAPAVNVIALVGHTALRSNHMGRLDRAATTAEIEAMRAQLKESLAAGAAGLSTGLAYLSAYSASTSEVMALASLLSESRAIYTTHLRSETETIVDAMREAFRIGESAGVPVLLSHLKCAGVDNWGRSGEVLQLLEQARGLQPVACDCYPYAAGSSTLDLRQVDERVKITITWSTPHPQAAGQTLEQMAAQWQICQLDAARRLQPAGAIYHSISEDDMRRILRHPATMIGSDGLPEDPHPHPRLWGAFPRVLGRYCREERLFSLATAIYKMTGMPAQRFALDRRGFIRKGYYADLVLFDPAIVTDTATFDAPVSAALGIEGVWVNGVLSYTASGATPARAGRFLRRNSRADTNEDSQ